MAVGKPGFEGRGPRTHEPLAVRRRAGGPLCRAGVNARHTQRRMPGVERSLHQRQGLGCEDTSALDLRSPQRHVTEGVEREGEERVLVVPRTQIRAIRQCSCYV